MKPNPIPGFPSPPPPKAPPATNPTPSPNPGPNPAPTPAPTPVPGGSTPPGTPSARPAGTPRPGATRGPGVTRRSREAAVTGENWHFWWDYNKDRFLRLKVRLFEQEGVTSESAAFFFGRRRRATRDTNRPGQAFVDKHLLPALRKALRDRDHPVRYRSAVALGKSGGPAELPLLTGALADKDELVREGAVTGIALLATPAARDVLLPLFEGNKKGRALLGGRKANDDLRGVAAIGLGLLVRDHPEADGDGAVRKALFRHSLGRGHDHHIPMASVMALGLMRGEVDAVRKIVDHLRKVAAPRSGALDWVRAQAVLAIGRILAENPAAKQTTDLDFVVTTLNRGKSANVRRSAAIAIGYIAAGESGPDADAVKALIGKLRRGKDRLTRGFAAVSLGRLGGDQALTALARGLRKEKGQLSAFCGIGLGILAADASRGASPERAPGGRPQESDEASRARREAMSGRRLKAIQHLRAAFVRMRTPDLKGGLAIALGIAHDREAGAMLLKALRNSSDRRFRGDCAVALGMVAHVEAAETLLRIMEHADADPRMREHAAVGLGLMGSRRVVRPLLAALKSEQSHYALVAITQALGLVGDRSAIEPLAKLVAAKRQPTYTRTYACWALGGIGDARDLPALTPVRSHHNYHACCVNLNAMLVLIDL